MVVVGVRQAGLELSWDRVRGHRLRRHGLVEPYPPGSAAPAASVVCGIHTQVESAAALSLARRVGGAGVGLLARRYLAAYGPASHQEFGQWLALPPGRAKQVYAALGGELVPVDVEGHRSWALAEQNPQS